MGITTEIEQLELNIKDAKHVIKLKKSLDALRKNKDFDLVILDEYFIGEASRLVQQKSAVHAQTPERQMFIDHGIVGLGSLQQFFAKIDAMYNEAQRSLEADQITHAELLGEEA